MRILVFCLILALALGIFTTASAIAGSGVKENAYGGRAYHHMALDLKAEDLREGTGDRGLAYRFSDGGMFEIYLPPERLAIASPDCSQLTVRMPWTDGAYADADQKVAEKRALFDRITAVRAGAQESVRVVLELDPYFERLGEQPRLTQCTVFFRQAFGAYVDHDGALTEE